MRVATPARPGESSEMRPRKIRHARK
jgi:hypothetical protein